MKRGGFWKTTVATGLLVAGLMTVGRAGLRSQGLLFLQGQMKIAAGDTDSGLKLLAEAASGPKIGTGLNNPLETVSAEPEKRCRKAASAPRVSRASRELPKIKHAPEPTIAGLVVPALPRVVQASYMRDGMGHLPTAQREAFRVQQIEFERAQRIREQDVNTALRETSLKYGPNALPDPEQIRIQVQQDLGAWAK
jgi:hypothetical protein